MDDRKKRKIDVAELDRLYDKRPEKNQSITSENVNPRSNNTEQNVSSIDLKKEIETIRETIKETHSREVQLLNNQIEQLQNHVENLNKNLHKALDVTVLLEDKREGQGAKEAERDAKLELLQKQIEKLETQNNRLQSREDERRKRIEERRKQAEAEKNKSWIARLFG